MKTLQTPRLLLEPLVPAHAVALYASLRDARLYTFIPQEPPPSPDSLRARYTMLAARRSPDGTEVWLNWALRRRDAQGRAGTAEAVTLDVGTAAGARNAYVGTVEATVYADHTASLAYMVFPPYWRQGYAKEGCARVLAHLFDDWSVTRVAAEIDTRNRASIRLAESLGFVRVALTRNADFFKGAPSDEYRYERAAPPAAGHRGQ